MVKHGIVRTDLMDGADVGARLVSARFYKDETPAAIDNGSVVKIEALEENEREIRKASVPAFNTPLNEIVLVATPEVLYDDRQHNLYEFFNEAGAPIRGYRLHSGNIFSVTKEVLSGLDNPAKGNVVELTADTKWNVVETPTANATAIGEIFDIETKNGITYYAILVK